MSGKPLDSGNQVIDPPVIPKPHPNTLVAIATARIAHQETDTATRVNTGLVTSVGTENNRFILVLDALASLAVARATGQVVAVGMQIKAGVAAITVSENEEIKEALKTHVQDLVNKLRAISLAKEADRPELELKFHKATYIYSIAKLYSRFNNRKWLEPFDIEFSKRDGPDELKCQVVLSALVTASEAIHKMKLKFNQKHDLAFKGHNNVNIEKALTEKEWTDLMFMMSSSIPDVEYLLGKSTLCNEWAEDLKGTVSVPSRVIGTVLPVPLFRAIEKLTSHHRHSLLLLDYATSPEGIKDLNTMPDIFVRQVQGDPPTVEVPNIPAVESALRLYMPKGLNLDSEMILIKANVQTQLMFALDEVQPRSFKGIIHCECALIAKFNEEVNPPGEPMTYIGVSKLSCAACYAWIQAFNASHDIKFQTRGCHGRWYPKWAMPVSRINMDEKQQKEETTLQDEMSRIVGQEYRKFYDAGSATRAILMSDSSESKARFLGTKWNAVELAEAVRLSREKRAERVEKANIANGVIALPAK